MVFNLKLFPDSKRPNYVNENPFFFSIGILSAKKNFHALLPLIEKFPDHKLIIAGKRDTSYGRHLQSLIDENHLESQVFLCGKVSDEVKYWLYNHCEALWFPSLAEGFGMPVIEAMLCGKPVFLSKQGSLPEIGGKHAFYWDNFDVQHMKEVVETGLVNFNGTPSNKTQLIEYARHFNWEHCIKQYIELYQSIAGN